MTDRLPLHMLAPDDADDGDAPVFDKAAGVWVPKKALGATLAGTALPDPALYPRRLFVLLDEASSAGGTYAGDLPPTGNTTPTGSASDYDVQVMSDAKYLLFYLPMANAAAPNLNDTSGNNRGFTLNDAAALNGAALLASGEGFSAKLTGGWLSRAYASWMNTGSDTSTIPGPFTFSALIRPDRIDGLRCIASRDGTTAGTRGWGFYIEDGKLVLDDGTGRVDGRAVANYGNPVIEASKTYHVGFAYTGMGEQVLFFVGGNALAGTTGIHYLNNTNPFLIGASYRGRSTTDAKFYGLISRPAFFTALYNFDHFKYQAQAAGLAAA